MRALRLAAAVAAATSCLPLQAVQAQTPAPRLAPDGRCLRLDVEIPKTACTIRSLPDVAFRNGPITSQGLAVGRDRLSTSSAPPAPVAGSPPRQ